MNERRALALFLRLSVVQLRRLNNVSCRRARTFTTSPTACCLRRSRFTALAPNENENLIKVSFVLNVTSRG